MLDGLGHETSDLSAKARSGQARPLASKPRWCSIGGVKNLRGHFLLAAESLVDPNFARSVVLLVKHDAEGALGLIVNRPTDYTVAQACEDVEAAEGVDEMIFSGGPCPGPMMALHERSELDDGELVIEGVHFTASRPVLEQLMSEPAGPRRFFAGYAGWGAEQLEGELAEEAWVVLPATPSDVFSDDPQLWNRLMGRANLLKYVRPERIPDDPRVN
jgi:putative transcriptional regulator